MNRFPLVSALLCVMCTLLCQAQLPTDNTICYAQRCNGTFSTQTPAKVEIGLYITDITQLSPEDQTFYMSAYYWYVWDTCAATSDGEPLVPMDHVVFETTATSWAETQRPNVYCADGESACPECDIPSDGKSLFGSFINGHFSMKFHYDYYPVDDQELIFAVEDNLYLAKDLVFVPSDDTNVHPTVQIPGFNLKKVILREKSVTQATSYGYKDGQDYTYSRLELGIVISRQRTFFVLKVFPPTLVTLAISVLTLLLDPLKVETRLGIATTGMLTLIFLALGSGEKVPDVGTITVNDWMFNWCYLLVIAIVVEAIVLDRTLKKIEHEAVIQGLGIEQWEIDAQKEDVNDHDRKMHKQEMLLMVREKQAWARRLDRKMVGAIVFLAGPGLIVVLLVASLT